MTRSELSSKNAAIHVVPRKDGNTSPIETVLDNGRVVADLKEREIDLVITSKASFEDGNWRTVDVRPDGTFVFTESRAAIDSIGALYSRVISPHPYIDDAGVTQFNPTNLKKFGRSKANTVGILGHQEIPTHIVKDANLDQLDLDPNTKEWILKPVRGSEGYGFRRVERAQLSAALEEIFEGEGAQNQVLQPYIGMGKVPEGVYGVSVEDRIAIDAAKYHNIPAELRIFVIKGLQSTGLVPVLRIAGPDAAHMDRQNSYVDVELEGDVAEAMQSTALEVAASIEEAAETKDSPYVMAVDTLYDGERYWVVEANVRSPGLPVTRNNPHAAGMAHTAIVDTLEELIKRGE